MSPDDRKRFRLLAAAGMVMLAVDTLAEALQDASDLTLTTEERDVLLEAKREAERVAWAVRKAV